MISRPQTIVADKKINNLIEKVIYSISLEGDFWECGVFRGGSAAFIVDYVPTDRNIYLFDSFEGLSEPNKFDLHKKGECSDVNYEHIHEYFSQFKNVTINKGWIPETFVGYENSKIALCHIDLDLYQPYIDTLEFVWPRLVDNGILLFDDCECNMCPGAKKAVDTFFADKKEICNWDEYEKNKHFLQKNRRLRHPRYEGA